MHLVERMSPLGTGAPLDVLARGRARPAQGRTAVHLEIGEPAFPTPAPVIAAGKRALDEGWTKYGSPQGMPDLREAIAAYISQTRSITVDPACVCVVPGGKPIMY